MAALYTDIFVKLNYDPLETDLEAVALLHPCQLGVLKNVKIQLDKIFHALHFTKQSTIGLSISIELISDQ